jgi:hypothetical protein
VHRVDRSYEVAERVLLEVKLHKSLIKFGKGTKLSPSFVEPFEVVEKKGLVAYKLAFHGSFSCVHDVFYVSVLRHYICDPSHFIDISYLQVLDEVL